MWRLWIRLRNVAARVAFCGILILAFVRPLAAQSSSRARQPAASPPSAPQGATEYSNFATLTEAERIAGLQKLLAADQQRQQTLEEQLRRLETEFEEASEAFAGLDMRLASGRAKLESVTSEAEKTQRQQEVADFDREREQARRRFDLIIDRRKAVQQQLAILAEKIALEERVLSRLEEGAPPEQILEPAAVRPEPAPVSEPAPEPTIPGLPKSTPDETTAAVEPAPELQEELLQIDERVVEARRTLDEKQAALATAKVELAELDEGIAIVKRDLDGAEQLLQTARNEMQAAAQSTREGTAELEKQREAGVPESEFDALRRRLEEEQLQLEQTREDVAQQTARVTESHSLLDRLQGGREAAVQKVEEAADAVDAARKRLWFLESPLAPHRIWRRAADCVPQILIVVVLMAFLLWASRVVSRRVVAALVRRSRRGSDAEREERAETLRRVFQDAAGLAIVVLGLLAVLDISGVNITVLLGSAAVIGAAVAFGSQNLIKDYFTGFMILLENQYSVGNVVRITGIAGVVEDVTLRMTVLRDEEGTRHFIPHGQVSTVSNLTHGWSRAVFQIGIGYGEDVDRVMDVLMDLAREMRDDEEFGPQILGEPEMQGVDAFGDSAVTIKFLVKTRPLKQWSVKRELLRRIKKRFDELEIEIPFPQSVVHYSRPGETQLRRETWGDVASRRDSDS